MSIRESGVGAALLGATLAIVRVSPEYVARGILRESWAWLPRLGTAGRTVILYTHLVRAIGFVLGVAAVFALGYRAGTRFDLRARYRRFVAILAIGGSVGYGVGLLAVVAPGLVSGEIAVRDGPSLVTLVVAGRVLAVSIQFGVIGFAGAAFASLVERRTAGRSAVEASESTASSE